MLPKRNRLRRTRDFSRVRRSGRSSGSSLLALYVLPVRSSDVRVGFSVSKKVGKATVRNCVKRRLREAVRQQLPDILPGQDLVFIARPAAATASYHELAETIGILLRKRSAIRAPQSARNA